MKAVLLAGGYGTRAKPFTDYIPKVMIPVDGRPIIDYVVRYLAKFSQISELLIICEFDSFGKQIVNYFEGKESIIGKKITFIEDKKNGTGGALITIEGYVCDDGCFLVWFADNLCALNVNELVHEYDEIIKDTVKYTGLIVVRKRRHEETGRVVLDSAKSINHHSTVSSIKQFIEKGITELEYPEAVGIYLFNNGIFGYLHDISEKKHGTFNLSHDLLANVINFGGKLYSYDIGDEVDWVDVESPSYSDRNKEIIMKITTQMGVDMPLRKNNT